MRKPENTFIDSVHRFFPDKEVPHREKMNNPYRSGTADVWYSGLHGDVWVEYKYLPKLPQKSTTLLADCSALQLKWLRARHAEGRNVHVIIGCPAGGVILSGLEWEESILISEFNKRLITRQAIAEWLALQTRGLIHHVTVGKPRNLRHTRKAAPCDERTADLR